MSSKQLNFFITQEDYSSINSFLMEHNAIMLTDNYINKKTNNNDLLKYKNEDIHQIYLTQNDFLDKVVIKNLENNIYYYYITSSFILELSLGGVYSYDKNLLQRGRFYYVKKYYDDNGNFVVKPDIFINWCDEIMKQFKTCFLKKHVMDKDCYYSETAIKWIELSNAKLINGGQQWSADKKFNVM